MSEAFATHDVFNQSPPFEDVNLFTTDRALPEAVSREGGGHAVKRLAAFGAVCGSAEAFQRGRLANEYPPRLRPFDSKGRRLDIVEFHPAYHECMEISVKEGLHCSAWDHLAKPGAQPVPGANVARSAGTYMATQMEAGHQCPITMTNAAVPTLLLEPELAKWWLPKILSRDYDKSFKPAAAKRGVTIGMGMTEKQGGTDVRANTTTAAPAGNGGPGAEYLITGHKWFMSAPMCDAFLVLAQAPGGLSCFLMPRFLPDGTVNALRFQRLKDKLGNRSNASSEVEFQAAHAWLIGEEGRGVPDHHRDGDVHAARLRGRLRRADAPGARQRHPPLPASHRVPEASRRPAADDPSAGRPGARCGGGDRPVVPAGAQLRSRLGHACGGLAPAHDPRHQILGVQDRAGAGLRGDGVPGRQRLRRGGPGRPALPRAAAQRHLGGLRQRHGARPAARAAARARDRRDRHGRLEQGGERRRAPQGASGAACRACCTSRACSTGAAGIWPRRWRCWRPAPSCGRTRPPPWPTRSSPRGCRARARQTYGQGLDWADTRAIVERALPM